MTIEPIAFFSSPFGSKFGIPRQSGVVPELSGEIVFVPEYRNPDALRGLDDFDFLWLIWGFSANVGAEKRLTVRPPRLGGNRQMGVFATRSPFRPNNLGLSSVRIEAITSDETRGQVIRVAGADLMDGTPIYDIKPYLEFADSHAGARGGFAGAGEWDVLKVDVPAGVLDRMTEREAAALIHTLEQDPRPQYHDDPQRVYGMPFGPWDVRFTVAGGVLRVVGVSVL